MGFHHDGLAGLELLTSGDPPTSASQSARITGVSHHARLNLCYFYRQDFTVTQFRVQYCNHSSRTAGPKHSPASAAIGAGTTGVHHCTQLGITFCFFDFIFETESSSVTRPVCGVAVSTYCKLCLLGSRDSPASASEQLGSQVPATMAG